ncbi:MAG: serine/threonine protein kinase, partial [Sorangium cellulosum]
MYKRRPLMGVWRTAMRTPGPMSFQPGAVIKGTPYRIIRPIGVGGMGEVYEVVHARTSRRLAIKVARTHLRDDVASLYRLVREGRALSSIQHPNVVKVFEAGELPNGRPYFAMELLEGTSMKNVIKRAPLSFARSVDLACQALDGLSAIHRHGLIHRDVKPSNLFLDLDGVLKVLDLGVVKSTNS